MIKESLEDKLDNSKDAPINIRKIRTIAQQISMFGGNKVTKDIFYDLIEQIVDLSNRVYELEYQQRMDHTNWAKASREWAEGGNTPSIWKDDLIPQGREEIINVGNVIEKGLEEIEVKIEPK